MTSTNKTQNRLSGMSLLNISLGIAIILAALIPVGKSILSLTGMLSPLNILEPHQKYAIGTIANYWLPTIFIYLLFRITKIDLKLKPSTTVSIIVLIANLLYLSYIIARILASTIPGGGASFAVASLSPIVIFPAWVLYGIGLFLLLKKQTNQDLSESNNLKYRKLQSIDFIVISFPLLISAIILVNTPLKKAIAVKSSFSSLCETAEIKILEKVNRAKSATLTQDVFTVVAKDRQSETGPWGTFLINQSLLEYIELPAPQKSEPSFSSAMVKMTTIGERILRSRPGTNQQTQYIFDSAPELTGEYIINSKTIHIPNGKELNLGGSRIEIHRRADNKLIAYAQYFWSNKEFDACPKKAHNGLFVFDFIVEALNVENPNRN